jgi:hypothetical protein
MHVWLRALRRIESTMPCMPWRVIFPSSSSVWNALESCSSCVSCTQLDMLLRPKVCQGDIWRCLVHCLCICPCPKCPRYLPPRLRRGVHGCGILTFLPKPAPCRLDKSLPLLTYLTSSLQDRPLITLLNPTRTSILTLCYFGDLGHDCYSAHELH